MRMLATSFQLICSAVFFLCLGVVLASPTVRRSAVDELIGQLTPIHPRCESDGEVESSDPCQPYCVCSKGKLICAQITCTDDFDLDDPKAKCEKVHVRGRCCHNYLCVHEDGTGTMMYPLPIVSAPDELYEIKRR
ncbi:uncharacterized protein LOC129593389 [Paramacrobiotus metropolitanus]|uniref:uncharacterized protein LOC129593389 n=1 Tax=Paramacrobiotus metropolitanus TaxID=2943436 RepID=UPI002445BD77|nr:uncharacterized protein LOC129593389 [Paramacrobiotus metropolitanus]